MNFYLPCEVVVLCLFPAPRIMLYLFLFCRNQQFFLYVNAKSKVTSEFVFHHVGIAFLISLKLVMKCSSITAIFKNHRCVNHLSRSVYQIHYITSKT